MKRLILVLLIQARLWAANYYVATTGDNANPGSQAQPWRNIWKAAITVSAGDIVTVQAGEYSEFITNTVSGTAGNPITFTGVRGANGEWLTIIDPSTPATSGWVAAPEVGSGVYKLTDLPFTVRELTIDHKRVGFVYTNGPMAGDIAAGYDTAVTTGAELLALPSNTQFPIDFGGYSPVNFWDGIEALYASTNKVCYLRFRDGRDPNGSNIRIAPNREEYVSRDLIWPAINMNNASYINYQNFLVRGAWGCVFMSGQSCHHNTISSNYFQGGTARLVMSTKAHDNTIQNNSVVSGYYGFDNLGAWDAGTTVTYGTRANLYVLSKHLEGQGSTMDDGIALLNAGSNNVVSGNVISGAMGNGISIYHETVSGAEYTRNTECFGNTVEKSVSVGIMLMEGQIGTKVYNNTVSDCNLNMRFHHMDAASEVERLCYIYRNRFWLPDSVGDHIYTHFDNGSGSYSPVFWVYHNSFSGGISMLSVSGFADDLLGLAGCSFLNNVISGTAYIGSASIGMAFWTGGSMVKIFDYNLVTPPVVTYPSANDPVWFGANNIKIGAAVWDTATNFALPAGSQAVNAGIDLTQAFVIAGNNYDALPATGAAKVGSAWDMGALEAGNHVRVRTIRGK